MFKARSGVGINVNLGVLILMGTLIARVQLLAGEAKPLMRDFIGINGHTVQFKPELYRPVGQLARDYHPVEWDLGKNTGELPSFPFAKNRVDWSRVYGSWKKQGWQVHASLMFESIKTNEWRNVAHDARAYGRALAEELGPSSRFKVLDSVEIGNEPGQWSDAGYSAMFEAMARGIREGDPALRIATCNVNTHPSGEYSKSVECVREMLPLVDILTIHTYAQLEPWPTWRRSFPEDPKLKDYLRDPQLLCEWRDRHAPDKPVWITEFGYDSSTQIPSEKGPMAKWVGVTDQQQAQWLVRSFLCFSAMPVERAYIYFFNDQDEPGLHASAGLTRRFHPKPSYHAVAQLCRLLGDYRFDRTVVNDPGSLRVQQYRHGEEPRRLVWAVWSPTGEGRQFLHELTRLPGKVVRVERMIEGLALENSTEPKMHSSTQGSLEVEVSESPLYVIMEAS